MEAIVDKKTKLNQCVQRWRSAHPELMRSYKTCEACGGRYQYNSRWNHERTKGHLYGIEIKKLQVQLAKALEQP